MGARWHKPVGCRHYRPFNLLVRHTCSHCHLRRKHHPIADTRVTQSNVCEGARVVRGPGWNALLGDQDGGAGMRGTVIGWSDRRGDYEGAFVRKDHEAGGEDGDATGMGWDHQRKGRAATHRKRAIVRWDRNGDQKGYWLGFRGMYELRHAPADPKLPLELGRARPRKGFRYAADGEQVAVTDTATKRVGDVVTMRTASVGAHVTKGPHWEHGNQDGGEKAGSQVGVITKTYTKASSKARRRSKKPKPDDVVERERFPEQRGHEARVLVRWEANGYEDDYRVGQDGCFDLVFAKDEYSPRDKLTPQAVEAVGDPGITAVGDPGTKAVAPLPRPAPPGVSCSGQPNDQSYGTRRRKYAYVFLEKESETVPTPHDGDGEPGVVVGGTNGSE